METTRTSDTYKRLMRMGLGARTAGTGRAPNKGAADSDERAEPLSAAAGRGGVSAGDIGSGIRLAWTNDHPATRKRAQRTPFLVIV